MRFPAVPHHSTAKLFLNLSDQKAVLHLSAFSSFLLRLRLQTSFFQCQLRWNRTVYIRQAARSIYFFKIIIIQIYNLSFYSVDLFQSLFYKDFSKNVTFLQDNSVRKVTFLQHAFSQKVTFLHHSQVQKVAFLHHSHVSPERVPGDTLRIYFFKSLA